MKDLKYYIHQYGFPNFNKSDYGQLITDLQDDFDESGYKFGNPYVNTNDWRSVARHEQEKNDFEKKALMRFKQNISKMFNIISFMKYNSNGTFNADFVWRQVFVIKISKICMAYFMPYMTKQFLDLVDVFIRPANYKATPSKEPVVDTVMDLYLRFMGLKPNFSQDELNKQFRILALRMHPDKGGSKEMFIKLYDIYRILKKT